MLNFDEARFRDIQTGAVLLAAPLHQAVGALLDEGAKNMFFLGAGGAGVLMLPAANLLMRSSSFPVRIEPPAELIVNDDVSLGRDSIVVIPSLSGTTPESIEMMEFAHRKGAKVIALTGHDQTPVADGQTSTSPTSPRMTPPLSRSTCSRC